MTHKPKAPASRPHLSQAMTTGLAMLIAVAGSTVFVASSAQASTRHVARASGWHTVHVARGQSLASILSARGVPAGTAARVAAADTHAHALRHLQPGDALALRKNAAGQLVGLRYAVDATHTLVVAGHGKVFDARIERRSAATKTVVATTAGKAKEAEKVSKVSKVSKTSDTATVALAPTGKTPATGARQIVAGGRIRHSLAGALKDAGVPASVSNDLAHIYKPRLALDQSIRPGDHFRLIYSVRYHNGHAVAAGPIIAARIVTHDQDLSAFRTTGPDGEPVYYDRHGQPFADGLSRHPVENARITSPFLAERMDPAVHFVHPHFGVDMAAPTGTPIHAAGSGEVKFVGWQHGYGRLVELRHADGYTTRYAHLHGFASHLHIGQRVQQGQVIGTVGSTGWSTGPHLLFEIRKNGVPHDPMTMPLPGATPLKHAERVKFEKRIKPLLKTLANPLIASLSVNAAVSAPGCANAALRNARMAIDPDVSLQRNTRSALMCIDHRPGPMPGAQQAMRRFASL